MLLISSLSFKTTKLDGVCWDCEKNRKGGFASCIMSIVSFPVSLAAVLKVKKSPRKTRAKLYIRRRNIRDLFQPFVDDFSVACEGAALYNLVVPVWCICAVFSSDQRQEVADIAGEQG